MSLFKEDRLEVANRVLQTFATDTAMELETGHVVISWTTQSTTFRRRWMTRGQDFYPVWKNKWPHGGTASTALSQLVRWVQGKPVLPIASWEYWSSDRIKLIRFGDAVEVLRQGGYPEKSPCVKCGSFDYHGGMDWFSMENKSGPGCFKCLKDSR